MTKRKKIGIFSLFLFICVIGVGVFGMYIIPQREVIEMEREQKMAYTQVNAAFLQIGDTWLTRVDLDIEEEGVYRPLPKVDLEVNNFGILVGIYVLLLMYEMETGKVLTYEMAIDYFSQEYEPDGSLRLHNNGKHPEINAFVEWMWAGGYWRRTYDRFNEAMRSAFYTYSRDNRDNGFAEQSFWSLSPQMLRVIAHATTDPERYVSEMGLTELQRAGY